MSGGIYSLKSTPNDKFFEKLFIAILFTFTVFARNLLRGKRWKNISFFIFGFDAWLAIRTWALRLNKPTHYLLDYGDWQQSFNFNTRPLCKWMSSQQAAEMNGLEKIFEKLNATCCRKTNKLREWLILYKHNFKRNWRLNGTREIIFVFTKMESRYKSSP